MKRILLIIAGFTMLALGGIGIILPMLPTTPFVLCAAGCFAASSPKLYRRLEGTKYFGEYIRNYRNKTGISERARWIGIGFLWLTLTISALISCKPFVIIILTIVGISVTVHLLTINGKK